MLFSSRYSIVILMFLMLSFNKSICQEMLDLKECLELAYSHNLILDKSRMSLKSKELYLQSYENERLPTVNGYANVFSNFGQSQDIFGNSARNDNLNSSFGLSSTYSILNNGKNKNSIKKGEMELKAGESDMALLKRDLSLRVIQGYLNVLLQKEISISTDSAFMFAMRQEQKIKKSTELGFTSLATLYEATANFAREKEKNNQAKYAVEKAMLDLKQTIGVSEEKQFVINTHIIENKNVFYENDSMLFNMSIQQHPIFKKMDYLNEALDYEYRVINSQRYPTIDFNFTLGSFYFNNLSSGFGKLPFFNQLQGNFSQQLGLTINVPIYNKGKVKLALQKNKVQREENLKQVEIEKLALKHELEKFLLDLAKFEKQFEANKEIMEITKKAFELSLKSYEAGIISIYDLNSSRSNLVNAESEMIKSKYNITFIKVLIAYVAVGEFN